jgi:hypothetical protein
MQYFNQTRFAKLTTSSTQKVEDRVQKNNIMWILLVGYLATCLLYSEVSAARLYGQVLYPKGNPGANKEIAVKGGT